MAPSSPTVSRLITKEGLCLLEELPSPCGIIIFGASGDLTHRKLLPSLFSLSEENLLPPSYFILGVARTVMSDAQFQQTVKESLGEVGSAEKRSEFLKRCVYHAGDYSDPTMYDALKKRLTDLDKSFATDGRHLFYLSTPPVLYEEVAQRLGKAGLAQAPSDKSWVRLVVEKPFGHDLPSAKSLNSALHNVFQEKQIYRIDHYLGKETVQNILMFRFANAMYEPIWNNKYIDHVQITAAESVGVEHRAGYYEQSGVLRDMFQNHLFQLLSLVAMEPPSSFEANALRNEKSKVLDSLCFSKDCDWSTRAVRGQYNSGTLESQAVAGYRHEQGVSPHSMTETFAALKVEIDNWRWHGVPFYLRSGKRMPKRATEILVVFKHVPSSIFQPLTADQMSSNILNFRIQPNEGISLRFEAKHPGPKLCMSSVTMQFGYEEAFGVKPPESYARLFHDVMIGDQTLFARQDWLTRSWRFLDPVVEKWASEKEKGLHLYPAGSWGPPESDELMTRDGRQWLTT